MIIVNYNVKHYVEQCLHSLRKEHRSRRHGPHRRGLAAHRTGHPHDFGPGRRDAHGRVPDLGRDVLQDHAAHRTPSLRRPAKFDLMQHDEGAEPGLD